MKGWVFALALSPDDKQAFVSERKPLVFDSGRHIGVKALGCRRRARCSTTSGPDFKDMYIAAAAFSPDGKVLALGRGGETR